MMFQSFCAFMSISLVTSLTINSIVTPGDRERLKTFFESAKPYGEDLQNIHYSLQGLGLLNGKLTKEEGQGVCKLVKDNVKDTNIDSLFYASGIATVLKSKFQTDCQVPLGKAEATLTGALSTDSSPQALHYTLNALKNLNLKFDEAKAKSMLTAALKKDDSPLSLGYGFMASSLLSGNLKEFHDLIEDVIPQADEIDGSILQFEGGLFTTAVIVDGVLRLSSAAKLPPTMKDDEVLKFAKYLLSRKYSHSLRNTAAMLSALATLANNPYKIPVSVFRSTPAMVSKDAGLLELSVTDILGNSLGKLTVTAESARNMKDDAVVISKKPFVAQTDGKLFRYDVMSAKPVTGSYRMSVSIQPDAKEKRLIGVTSLEVDFMVITDVVVGETELSLLDKEQNTQLKTYKVTLPNTVPAVIEADIHQKLVMKFALSDVSNGNMMLAHQVFVKFTSVQKNEEIIFVAETDKARSGYIFELDIGAKQKEFARASGKYSMELVVGDPLIKNSVQWKLANVQLTFQDDQVISSDPMQLYQPQPEIKHLFREPEVRPPTVVSNLFTLLVLAPLLLLFIIWMRIGFSIEFPTSISALIFHGGLAAIFVIYISYWFTLNMFIALRYLALLGVPTFFFGNKLLTHLASKRMK